MPSLGAAEMLIILAMLTVIVFWGLVIWGLVALFKRIRRPRYDPTLIHDAYNSRLHRQGRQEH